MNQQQDTVTVGLSIIAYLRNFFKESSFTVSKQDNINLKIVKKTPESAKFVEWIEQIKKSIDQVHRIVLGVYNRSKELIEKYTISTSGLDIKKACISIQRMKPIKEKISIKIKLYAYSKINLDGFTNGNEEWSIENSLETKIPGLSIAVTSFTGSNNNISNNKRSNANSNSNGLNENKSNENKSNENKLNENSNGLRDVRCTCTLDNLDGEMLQCDSCKNWLHTVCIGYFSNQDKRIPDSFQCQFCLGTYNRDSRDCSVFRRSLGIAFNDAEFNGSEYLIKRLGISTSYSKNLIAKMRKEGFISCSNKIYKTGEVKEKIKQYFNGKKMECFISSEISLDQFDKI